MADKKKTLTDYMKLDYPVELIRDSDQGGFFARHPDLPGCTAEGDTAEEAVNNLDESRELWIEARLESGFPVPIPLSEEYGGRISLRITRGLHAALARAAGRQGMSLNQLLNVILSEWSGGISVKDTVVKELRSLLAPAVTARREMTETKTETKTETTTETRSLYLIHGGTNIKATAEAGN